MGHSFYYLGKASHRARRAKGLEQLQGGGADADGAGFALAEEANVAASSSGSMSSQRSRHSSETRQPSK